ncbi:MAG: efflux RND transporter permease subunit, partial [Planctomycetota bacterium]
GRTTIVIALAIPTSIIGTFLMLHLLGRSLNVISLAGLAFAVGMLVDNAVVVLENVFRHYQAGEDPFHATVRGTKEVWGAVVASTLTTLAVFLPVLFVQEEAGQLFRDIALAISSAVGLSLIVSVTVIPTAAARILRRHGEQAPPEERSPAGHSEVPLRPFDALGRMFVNRVVAVNALLQHSILLRLATVALFVGGSLGISWLMMPSVEYLPTANANSVIGVLQPPAGYDIERLLELGKKLEEDIKPYWDVDKGNPANERLDFPPIESYCVFPTKDRLYFVLRAVDPMRAGELVPLVQTLGTQFPGMITFASQQSVFSFDLSGGRTVDIEISGPELPKLVELGRRIFGQGERPEDRRLDVHQVVPGCLAFPSPSLDLSMPELHLVRKLEEAADMGLSTEELGYTVDALIDGAYATDYYLAGDKIDLTLVGGGEFVEYTQDVPGLIINTPSGELARLESLADVRLAGGPEQINRRERQRAITVSVVPPREMPLERAVDLIDSHIIEPLRKSGEIGGAYQVRLSGTADKLRTTWRALKWNFLLALLITYLLMAALFESWLYPLVIILSVPLGAAGGFLGLTALNWYLSLQPHSAPQSLDVLTMLGFVILIGTVVNNPILIVHQSLNHMRDDRMSPNDAILASVRTRIRPIFVTTATTVLGLSPLVLLPGQGSELYRGLGAVVLGGLVVSTLVTLVLVPTLFSLMMEARAGLRRFLSSERV